MRARLAPLLALIFFTAACAMIVAEPYAPGLTRYAIVALSLSNAAILWAYFGITPPPLHPRRRRRHQPPARHMTVRVARRAGKP